MLATSLSIENLLKGLKSSKETDPYEISDFVLKDCDIALGILRPTYYQRYETKWK